MYFLCICFSYRCVVFHSSTIKITLLLVLLNGCGRYNSMILHWEMGLSLFLFPFTNPWHWCFEKVHALRINSGPYTMELLFSLCHQYTFIFLFNRFSEGLSLKVTFALKRDPWLLKSVQHFISKFRLTTWPLLMVMHYTSALVFGLW